MADKSGILIIRYLPGKGSGRVDVVRRVTEGPEVHVFGHRYMGVENWVPEVRPVLSKALAEGDTGVVVDLGAVDWINSLGLGMLMVLYQEVAKAGGRTIFANPRERVVKILRATKLDRVLKTADSVEEAVAQLGGA
jgi:anti-anti-sigma factor